jgi:Arc/MetJ family transcription regulator
LVLVRWVGKAELDIHTKHAKHTHVKRTNIVLDEKIVETARRLTGISTQRELVDYALRELVKRHQISKILELEGTIDWDGDLAEMRSGRELCEF